MKLRNLNAAIDAAPEIYVLFSFGPVELKKVSLKKLLKVRFGRTGGLTETGLKVTEWSPGPGEPPVMFLMWDKPPSLF